MCQTSVFESVFTETVLKAISCSWAANSQMHTGLDDEIVPQCTEHVLVDVLLKPGVSCMHK